MKEQSDNQFDAASGSEPHGAPLAGVRHLLDLARRRRRALALCAVFGLGASLAWLGDSEPVYRASATVLLDDNDAASATLSELSLLGSAPRAPSEIALLSSRALAEAVAAGPDEAHASGDPLRHLGLDVEVDDLDRRPLQAAFGRFFGIAPSPALDVACDVIAPDAAERVLVSFREPGVVDLARLGAAPYAEHFAGSTQHFDYQAGAPIEFDGLRLVLRTHSGEEPSGTFLIERKARDRAVRDLLGSTRAMETQRNSGVLELTVSDSDPVRAAAKANAICLNYFDLKIERSRRRASQSITFIEAQLREQTQALTQAEAEVVELRRQNPALIDISSAAGRIVDQLSSFEVERLRISLALRALDEALELAQAGDDRGLSQLGQDLADPLSTGLVERLETLGLERFAASRADGGPYRTLLQQRASQLDERADEARLELEALAAILVQADAGEAGAFARLSTSSGGGVSIDPLTLSYLAELGRLESENEVLSSTYTAEHPARPAMERAIGELRARLVANLESRADALRELAEERRILAAAARDAASLQPQRDLEAIDAALVATRERIATHLAARSKALDRKHGELDQICQDLEAQLGELPEQERLVAGPLRKLETHKELTTLLLKSMQEAQIARASALASADFVDRAAPPILRYAPRLGFSLVVGTLAGFVLGLALLALREHLSEAIETERDLERAANLPVLGSIPDFRRGPRRVAGAGDDFVAVRDDPSGPVAESYRSLRASLRFAVGDMNALRTLAVTSSAPGEGKSTTNVDLAWCLAGPGRRVLLVDADLRRPSVHRYLAVAPGPGLAECLVTGADWRACIQPSGRDRLDVLAAGKGDGVSADLLGAAAMERLLDEWTAEYDLVVFDLPPALVVADVETFAHRLDAVLLAYRAGGLPARALENTVKRLRSAGVNLVGLVLNASRPEVSRGGAAYGVYYRARSAYFDNEDARQRA